MHNIDADTRAALDAAWHRDSAASSLERWLDLSAQEGWEMPPQHMPALVSLFGASWFFTRFLFYRGAATVPLFEEVAATILDTDSIRQRLQPVLDIPEHEAALDALRVTKNEIMVQILLADVRDGAAQAELERALTVLAESTLNIALALFGRNSRIDFAAIPGVLGMGRMAGYEMNFGSDLDLIFLYSGDSPEQLVQASTLFRVLLRGIATAAPAGSLYEVDMRLRPHGSAGALITSRQSFEDYHAGDREIWERQMMTRCRAVVDHDGMAAATLQAIAPYIFADHDPDVLRVAIRDMRSRVEHELGSPAGRYELKRGPGGIMDIDFICHYLQLAHAHAHPQLQQASTRRVLAELEQLRLLSTAQARELLLAYDFLKRVESRLRVFDMKSVSSFPREPAGLLSLTRALEFNGETELAAAENFLAHYLDVTCQVRRIFDEVL